MREADHRFSLFICPNNDNDPSFPYAPLHSPLIELTYNQKYKYNQIRKNRYAHFS